MKLPELESVEHLYFRTCDVCGGKRPIKNLDVSHTTGVCPSDLIQCELACPCLMSRRFIPFTPSHLLQ